MYRDVTGLKRGKDMLKRLLILVLCLAMHASGTAYAAADYRGASSWAVAELGKAVEYGIITDRIKGNMSGKITREEFAEVAVKLYEKYTGKTAAAGSASFTDTKNPEILKAANLGLIAGFGNNKYTPNDLITRQQMATILLRALKVINPSADFSTAGASKFADDGKVQSWARDGVYYCFNFGLVTGVGNNRFDPDGNASREQAVIVCKRAYEYYKNGVVTVQNTASNQNTSSNQNTTSTVHPSQLRLKLPPALPGEIPFTSDAKQLMITDDSTCRRHTAYKMSKR